MTRSGMRPAGRGARPPRAGTDHETIDGSALTLAGVLGDSSAAGGRP
jgi:hypothetical protein